MGEWILKGAGLTFRELLATPVGRKRLVLIYYISSKVVVEIRNLEQVVNLVRDAPKKPQ